MISDGCFFKISQVEGSFGDRCSKGLYPSPFSRKTEAIGCVCVRTRKERFKIVVVQSLSRVRLFATPWTAALQASLSITNSQSLLKLMSIKSVMPSNLMSSPPDVPFSSCLQSFPVSGSFPVSQFCPSGGQSIGVSASTSVLPVNIQD